MVISKNKVVAIDYTLRNSEGEIIDASAGQEPLVYIQGIGNLIPGLEEMLEGKKVGDTFKAVIPPEKAYGEFDESLVQLIPSKHFAQIPNLEVGMQLQANMDGQIRIVTVTAIEENSVEIDANHPLSGETLDFDVTVKSIREASQEELDHGHVHGEGGHHH
ncbi:MAG TPA: peptidylprolyl isomerase [Leptospiraceae bacterium]|nr:peptidylprolyl isomerase [Leptospiraceae bacterium]HMW04403.1 peptidylprolyl isomerase [Leptospiraceae bacterium]HMX35340.1 peptidylprolyl isomerase [Leptospiraceae bacterium]HMY34121.1 peptidylprolyl isomerase [Leptospiraceae bacterium]HMZ63832.1 peptidylprolyl isomerase [Leptospiraceae bacterium]